MICQWWALWQIIDLRDTGKSRYFAITEFNNCFIIGSWPSLFFNEYFREAKRSAIFHPRVTARRRKAWYRLRMSRILFAAKHNPDPSGYGQTNTAILLTRARCWGTPLLMSFMYKGDHWSAWLYDSSIIKLSLIFFSSVTCLGIPSTATAVLNGCDCYLWRTCYMLYKMENISNVLHRCGLGTRLWFLCFTINCVVSQRDSLLTKYNLQIFILITFGQVFMVKRKVRINHKCAFMEDNN